MTSPRRLLAGLLLLAGFAAAPSAAFAAEGYDNCAGFIDTVPATISTQGVWCLRHDLSTAIAGGAAITIDGNNITIDCNDFKLGGLAAGAGTTASGIHALNRLNATVRNCNVRGFFAGIVLEGTGGGHAVEDNRLDGNTAFGLAVSGDGSVVRRNRVLDTGGSIAIGGEADGIVAYESVDVLDNIVSGVLPGVDGGGDGGAKGIFTANNPSGRVVGNTVRGVIAVGDGKAYGIANATHQRIIVRGNDISGDGSVGSTGLSCVGGDGHAVDNVILGFGTGISTCTNDGNVVAP